MGVCTEAGNLELSSRSKYCMKNKEKVSRYNFEFLEIQLDMLKKENRVIYSLV